jgi:hypothetical protein
VPRPQKSQVEIFLLSIQEENSKRMKNYLLLERSRFIGAIVKVVAFVEEFAIEEFHWEIAVEAFEIEVEQMLQDYS